MWSWWSGQPSVWLDPKAIHTAGTPVDEDVLESYKDNPRRRSSDRNDPCVVGLRSGGYHVLDGKHRTLAAQDTGRKIKVRLAYE